MKTKYILGLGLSIPKSFELYEDVTILPYKEDGKDLDYPSIKEALFYSFLADRISFAIKVTGKNTEEVARKAWNLQWLGVFLSLITEAPCSTKFYLDYTENFKLIKSINNFLSPWMFRSSTEFTNAHFEVCKNYFEVYERLLSEESFSSAVAIYTNNYSEPRQTIRLMSIWSAIEGLINVQHELTFRISLYIAFMLASDGESKKLIYEKVRGLYHEPLKSGSWYKF